jgi:hypothetical protein
MVADGPAELHEVTCAQKNIIFFIFISFPWGLDPRMSTGLSHESPAFDFEVSFCPTPTS